LIFEVAPGDDFEKIHCITIAVVIAIWYRSVLDMVLSSVYEGPEGLALPSARTGRGSTVKDPLGGSTDKDA